MPIPIISDIVPQNNGDFPTHTDIYGKGGYQVQPTTAARDAIPALRRKEGMVVFVVADGTEYRLNAGLLTWTAVPSGGGTLAGDVTGPSSANVVERLTGLAGVVAVPTAALAFGTTPATAGLLRFANGAVIATARNAAGAANINLLQVDSSNQLIIGDTTALVSAGATFIYGQGSVQLRLASSGTILAATATQIQVQVPTINWTNAIASPTLSQLARTSDALPQTLTIAPQQPYATATGANTKPGDFRLDLGTPTNGGATYADAYFRWGGSDRIRFGYVSGATTGAFIAIAPRNSGTPSANIATTGEIRVANTFLMSARNFADTTNYPVLYGNNNTAVFGGDLSGVGYDGAILNGVSSTSLYVGATPYLQAVASRNRLNVALLEFAIALSSPSIIQAGQNVDALPQNLTIRPQQPFATATGANRKPGNLVLDFGTPTNGGTTYGDHSFTADGVEIGGFRAFTGSQVALYAGTIAGATSPRFLMAGNGGYTLTAPNGGYSINIAAGNSHTFQSGGVTMLQIVGAASGMFVGQPFVRFFETLPNVQFQSDARTSDAATNTLGVVGSGAFASSTGTNRDGGLLFLTGGIRKTADTNGRRKGVQIRIENLTSGILFEASDVQAEATSPSRVISLLRTAAITTTQMPTNTGDLTIYVGNAATNPSADAVSGHIYYSDGAKPAWRFNATNLRLDGTDTTASAGAGAAPPGTVEGYLTVTINGTARKIPYYAN